MHTPNPPNRPNIHNLAYPQLTEYFSALGEPAYRTDQVWSGLYKQFVVTPMDIYNLPTRLREQLARDFQFKGLQEIQQQLSQDKRTVKKLLRLSGGEFIEAVLMQYDKRNTLCISSQVGCAMNCSFCATGQMGFRRNLTSGEIIEQVLLYARYLLSMDERVTNIVLMGMGEPFHNYDAVMQAITTLNDPHGMNLGERRFTISTVGIIPMIKRFTSENRQVNLAISLHAVDDALRSSMLPVNRKYPVDALLATCREYVDHTRRRISFEWALIQDVNDSAEHARKLSKKLAGMLCHVNLIPLNPTSGYAGKGSPRERANAFLKILTDTGISGTIRMRRGMDIQSGCGQLATQNNP
ncbi:MAG: 23S rRNA (adenine(2503)-C(2))-methyltransferase RlmN [Anaerolineae bacterium]|nr:23S rRNA (adenine(2503)-C(2))-methyltransferase RlmN [Anaerolineae bacterium]